MTSDRKNRFKTTVYGRLNKTVEPLTEFEISKFEKVFNPNKF